MQATNLRSTGTYRVRRITESNGKGAQMRCPTSLNELRRILDPGSGAALPIRPQGAGSSCTDSNATGFGTTLSLIKIDRIVQVDSYNHTVTAQAGVRIGDLVAELAEHGLELIGGYDLASRTIGGAIASPCYGACIGATSAFFASNVVAMKVLRADGQVIRIQADQKNLLGAFRTSYGALGVIVEVTLRVRPLRTFSVSHRRISIDKFTAVVDTLAHGDVGFRFFLMPWRDCVYLELRRYENAPGTPHQLAWKFKDWGERALLPRICRTVNRIVPNSSLRYRLIDSAAETTQGLVSSGLVTAGSNALPQAGRNRRLNQHNYSTWCFPAVDFSMVAKAYREFCEATRVESQYRCDLPAVGYRLSRDATSLLSPSFDEPMIALTTASTQAKGWDDFVIDLAEFSEKWGGVPLISQSRALRAEHVIQAYHKRLDFFRRMRRQLDPDKRLLNPFLAQFLQ